MDDNLPKPEDDSEEVADWFNTKTDPEIAQAVAAAVADARAPVQGAIPAGPIDPLPPMQYPPLSQQAQPPTGRHSGSPEG